MEDNTTLLKKYSVSLSSKTIRS